jgi:hypothetical protein
MVKSFAGHLTVSNWWHADPNNVMSRLHGEQGRSHERQSFSHARMVGEQFRTQYEITFTRFPIPLSPENHKLVFQIHHEPGELSRISHGYWLADVRLQAGTRWFLFATPGIATYYGLDGRGSIPGRGKRFSSIPHRPVRLWGLPSLLTNGSRYSSLGFKRPGHEADHLPPSSA